MASRLLLKQLSTRSASFLWLMLGFVASFLYRDDERGRLSAARCLEAIARLVPKGEFGWCVVDGWLLGAWRVVGG